MIAVPFIPYSSPAPTDGPSAHVTSLAHARDLLVVVRGATEGVARCGEFLGRTSPLPLAKVPHGDRCRTCWTGEA